MMTAVSMFFSVQGAADLSFVVDIDVQFSLAAN